MFSQPGMFLKGHGMFTRRTDQNVVNESLAQAGERWTQQVSKRECARMVVTMVSPDTVG